jgi:hypothetical protein
MSSQLPPFDPEEWIANAKSRAQEEREHDIAAGYIHLTTNQHGIGVVLAEMPNMSFSAEDLSSGLEIPLETTRAALESLVEKGLLEPVFGSNPDQITFQAKDSQRLKEVVTQNSTRISEEVQRLLKVIEERAEDE